MFLSKDRVGRFTASKTSTLFTGGKGVTRGNYIMEKAEEKITGLQQFKSYKQTEHGEYNEIEACEAFEKVFGVQLDFLAGEFFPLGENGGATPDAKITDFSGKILAVADAKCPVSTYWKQKLMILQDSKPEFQNVPKDYFYQLQHQMLAAKCDISILFRYLTSYVEDSMGNKIEIDLPLSKRIFYKEVKADKIVQEQILEQIEAAAKERDVLIEILLTDINQGKFTLSI